MKEFILNQEELSVLHQAIAHSSLKESASIKDLSKEGPIILNFILGTWCPLCLDHVRAINNVIQSNDVKIIVISTESINKLDREFSKSISGKLSDLPILFCSDVNRSLVNIFKLKIPVFGFSKPATFILTNDTIKMISSGVPNKEQTICDISHYLKAA